MKYHENILCISYAELTDGDPNDANESMRPIISASNLQYLVQRGQIRVVRRGCFGQSALYAYNSLPEKYRDKVVDKYGDVEKKATRSSLRDIFERDMRAENFYQTYTTDGHTHLTPETIKLYVNNASALNAVIDLYARRVAAIKLRNGSCGRVMGEICDELSLIQAELGCKLPKNSQSFRRVLDRYRKEGYASLISKKLGNSNADKTSSKERKALMDELCGDGRNLNNETVAMLYNTVAAKLGWSTVTAATVGNFRRRHTETFAGRYGSRAYKNEQYMLIQRSAPTAPMFYWTADGWDAELLYQKTLVNPEGRSVTTYHNRPTVVMVIDPYNKYIIGYAIGTHETPELIRAAFRNAFEHVFELFGDYYRPWQIQTDNYEKKTLTDFYSALTHYYTPAEQGNAKAKIIEPFFNWFNQQYCRLCPNTSGVGVKGRRKNQVSDDWIKNHKKDFPDYEGVVNQLASLIEMDRKIKVDKYLEGWKSLSEDRKLSFPRINWLSTFGELAQPRKMQPMGIQLQLNGIIRWYDTDDRDFRNYGHKTWYVRYDPNDMSSVLAVVNVGTQKKPLEGTIRFLLEEKQKQPMALVERKQGDIDNLMKVQRFNQGMDQDVIRKRSESAETVRALFEDNRELLEDTLTAHVITDSLGQHKNQRNSLRAATAPKAVAPVKQQELEEAEEYTIDIDENDFLNDF